MMFGLEDKLEELMKLSESRPLINLDKKVITVNKTAARMVQTSASKDKNFWITSNRQKWVIGYQIAWRFFVAVSRLKFLNLWNVLELFCFTN